MFFPRTGCKGLELRARFSVQSTVVYTYSRALGSLCRVQHFTRSKGGRGNEAAPRFTAAETQLVHTTRCTGGRNIAAGAQVGGKGCALRCVASLASNTVPLRLFENKKTWPPNMRPMSLPFHTHSHLHTVSYTHLTLPTNREV